MGAIVCQETCGNEDSRLRGKSSWDQQLPSTVSTSSSIRIFQDIFKASKCKHTWSRNSQRCVRGWSPYLVTHHQTNKPIRDFLVRTNTVGTRNGITTSTTTREKRNFTTYETATTPLTTPTTIKLFNKNSGNTKRVATATMRQIVRKRRRTTILTWKRITFLCSILRSQWK